MRACLSKCPYDWRGFERAKKKTSVCLLSFNVGHAPPPPSTAGQLITQSPILIVLVAFWDALGDGVGVEGGGYNVQKL